MQELPSLTAVSTAHVAQPEEFAAIAASPAESGASNTPRARARQRLRDMDKVVWCLLLLQIAILLAAGWIGA